MIGTSLSHYRITAKLGQGGMGEVYRATDQHLGRDVAIKVLPDEVATDPDRLARFKREAHLLASLNHTNIAAIHGLEEADGKPFLVLELVEGEELSARIERGPIPIDEAIKMAAQIAEALEEAHEGGIVHRDLKPANIKITPDDKVKVLDFGLAKAFAYGPEEGSSPDLSQSPTMSAQATQAGVILGTAAYMSPEQARGKSVDKRADIWAFGVVLFEMLTGERLFTGETVSDVLAAVLTKDVDFGRVPGATAAPVVQLLRRCLTRDPRQRLRDIGEARYALSDDASLATTSREASRTPAWLRVLPWTIAAVASMVAWVTYRGADRADSPATATVRSTIELPGTAPMLNAPYSTISLSSDGSRLAYLAQTESGPQIYVRSLAEFDARPLSGTEGGLCPFLSPDGEWVGFFEGSKLKKVPYAGGAVVTLADTGGRACFADWGFHDTIALAMDGPEQSLRRVSGTGGPIESATSLDREESDRMHLWPQWLPDTGGLLFTITSWSLELRRIAVAQPGAAERKVVVEDAWHARFVPSMARSGHGHLVFLQKQTLMTAPFDAGSARLEGPAISVIDGFTGHFDVSDTGSLVFAPGSGVAADYSLVSVDRQGSSRPILEARRGYEDLHVSPDSHRVALTIEEEAAHVWLADTRRGSLTRMAIEGESRDPIWSPDGLYVAYGGKRDGTHGIFRMRYDGSEAEQTLVLNDRAEWLDPISWTPDGRYLLYDRRDPATGDDIWMLEVDGDGTPTPFLQTAENEYSPRISPDGEWVAYNSLDSGREEVYVQAFPEGGRRWQISIDGGRNPIWSRDGREVFYRNDDEMFATAVDTRDGFNAGKPELLFEGSYRATGRDYDVTPDGRFVMMNYESPEPITRLELVLNFAAELDGLTAPAR